MTSPNPSIRPRALVTGGAHGIGWAICKRLAAQGHRVVLADIDAQTGAARVAELGDGHAFLPVDLLASGAAAALPGRAADLLGGLDVIVNNAGMTDSTGATLVDLPDAAFDRLVALNLTALTDICAAAPQVLAQSHAARIVNLASGASFKPLALRGPYSATKAGVHALTRALARDYADLGISVTALAPGYTLTPLVQELADQGRVDLTAVSAAIPMGRVGLPEDIAAVVAYCAGPEGALLTGQTLGVDGGGLMGPATPGTAPQAGTERDGPIAVLGAAPDLAAELPDGMTALDHPAQLETLKTLAGVIDLAPHNTAPALLTHSRDVARACAAHPARTRDFALLFAALTPTTPTTPETTAALAARGMLARTLALEWAGAGMRVNALTWRGTVTRPCLALGAFLTGTETTYMTGQELHAGPPA